MQPCFSFSANKMEVYKRVERLKSRAQQMDIADAHDSAQKFHQEE